MISIIDYRAGNLKSVERALRHLGIGCRITDDPADILSSERVIFPGVGAAGKTMEVIESLHLDGVIHEVVRRKTPFLGICLGAQIILETSEEDDTACLKLIAGRVRRFPHMGSKLPERGSKVPESGSEISERGIEIPERGIKIPERGIKIPERGIKIPHMGWNNITIERNHPLLDGIDRAAQFYFVHSYYPEPLHREDIIATTRYGISFASVIGRGNVVATQFHPEKSGRFGLQLLQNFSQWDGTC